MKHTHRTSETYTQHLKHAHKLRPACHITYQFEYGVGVLMRVNEGAVALPVVVGPKVRFVLSQNIQTYHRCGHRHCAILQYMHSFNAYMRVNRAIGRSLHPFVRAFLCVLLCLFAPSTALGVLSCQSATTQPRNRVTCRMHGGVDRCGQVWTGVDTVEERDGDHVHTRLSHMPLNTRISSSSQCMYRHVLHCAVIHSKSKDTHRIAHSAESYTHNGTNSGYVQYRRAVCTWTLVSSFCHACVLRVPASQ